MVLQLVQSLKYHLKWRRCYLETFSQIPDRQVFHEEILPTLADMPDIQSVLDLGCEWFNLHHRRVFQHHRYATMDIVPEKARFGARRHVVGSALELDQHFQTEEFDLVIANGLLGWGVNSARDVETFSTQVAYALRPGGILLVGWNDNESNRPELMPRDAFAGQTFSPWPLPTRQLDRFVANPESGHTFEFFQKAAGSEVAKNMTVASVMPDVAEV